MFQRRIFGSVTVNKKLLEFKVRIVRKGMASAAESTSSSIEIKIVLLGQRYVGKTALMERFLHERFLSPDGYQTTIGAAYGSKRMWLKAPNSGRSVVIGLWDTAGEERYQSLTRMYYRRARAAVLCYDVTQASSLDRAQFWANELAKYEPNCRVYVCGCKLDLVADDPAARAVSPSTVRKLAKDLGAPTFETSSKTGENVAELFAAIAEDFVGASSVSAAGAASASGEVSLHQNSKQQQTPSQRQQKQCDC